jgi:Pyruvate/2-oxoacid:ferredoxin oxidoreductase delta subunit
MGSGGLIVMDEDTCVVDLAHYFLKFTQKESCGKCAPCRLGTSHMVQILGRITSGCGTEDDIPRLLQLSDTIQKASLCGLGQTAPNPVVTTLKYFLQEYEQHIAHAFCPAGVCGSLFDLEILSNKCTGCRVCVTVCPSGAIQGTRRYPHTLDKSFCTHCKACVEVCRFDAIIPVPVSIKNAV